MATSIPPRQETARETPFFAPRLSVLAAAAGLLFFILAGRLIFLCILRGDEYHKLGNAQSTRHESIPAPRGRIYDRYFGSRFERPLAVNLTGYSAYLRPGLETTGTLCQSLDVFAALTQREDDALEAKEWLLAQAATPKGRKRLKSKEKLLSQRLPFEVAVPVAERAAIDMPGIFLERIFMRVVCPGGTVEERRAFSHVIGYIHPIAGNDMPKTRAAEIATLEAGDNTVDLLRDRIGKRNIEKCYEDLLRGVKGRKMQQYDAHGRKVGDPIILPGNNAQVGADLILTIDAELQIKASCLLNQALTEEGLSCNGALIAMDPRNGEILALASYPEYAYPADPGYTEDSPFNRAISGQYPPGSTFKIVPAAAGLRSGIISPETEFYCEKEWKYGNTPFHCLGRHEEVRLYEALGKSCNIYFFKTAKALGWGLIAETAREFGFGQSANIDLWPTDRKAIATGPFTVKNQTRVNGVVIQMAIGQAEYVLVTPLQVLCAYAAIAHPQGILLRPHLLKEARYHDERGRRVEDPGHRGATPASHPYIRKHLIKGLRETIEHPYGTGRNAGFEKEWKVAGKTGSAEIAGKPLTHAWFAGFAPWDDPEIAVVVLCEYAGHGGDIAAPIAAKFLHAYFNLTRPKLEELHAAGIEPLRLTLDKKTPWFDPEILAADAEETPGAEETDEATGAEILEE